MNRFYLQVYAVVRQVPRGRVVSYGQIGSYLGAPRAGRQVGRAMRCCPEDLPWHRVVMADGGIAGGGYAALRRQLLAEEGVPFLPDGRVDMAACRFVGPVVVPDEPNAPEEAAL